MSSTTLRQRLLEEFFPGSTPANFVGGQWATGATEDVTDPSTGMPYSTVPLTSPSDLRSAVDAAEQAQPDWSRRPLAERIECLQAFAELLRAHGHALSVLESVDSGNPLPATRRDTGLALRYLRDWPAWAIAQQGRASRPFDDGLSYTVREPYGVVGRIIAYNHPMLFAVAGMILPLLAGNTMVIKAAPQTPVATLALGRLLREALPDGVVNLLTGDGAAGDALVTDPRVKRLSFVGSEQTAVTIQGRLGAGGAVKHFTTELGGKNAMIVADDVDLDEAAQAAVAGMSLTVSQGQSCQSTSRLIAHESIIEPLTARVRKLMSGLSMGVAYQDGVQMGPLVSAPHLDRVRGFLAEAEQAGADVVECPTDDAADRPQGGYYLAPHLVVGADPSSRVATEEIFGPVLSVHPFTTEDEALALANEVRHGLSAAVWSRDLDRALRLAHGVDAGYVWVNDANRHYPGAPFGGMKGSGVGREECPEELDSYTELKAVNVRIRPAPGGAA
ncbi:aldehyde dehydrogenase family protein [Ornithinimicrobium cavernae]|uniref:aldehyde dehydrogenase family protein n=1 Tax=Ornithinimicrobium cavernae TaxID=2666047 RepID=UPI000D6936AF|nr:aldehyde dehydrogenase family protein [Ornithinimicrobium cavernae]